MKLIHITNDLHTGGVQKLLFDVNSKLIKRDASIEIKIITVCDLGDMTGRFEASGIEVKLFPCWKNKSLKYISLIEMLRLVRYLRREKPDIVQTHLFLGGLIGRLAAIFAGVKSIIHTEHNVYLWKNFYHKFIDYILALFMKKIIVVSESVKNFCIKKCKISGLKLITINNGINFEDFKEIDDAAVAAVKNNYGLNSDDLIIGFTGRLVEQKNVKTLILAFEKIIKNHGNVKLLIVGDGKQKHEFQQYASEHNFTDKIIWTGVVENINSVLLIMDIFVLPSFYEGFGLSLYEAMAMRKSVIVSNIPAFKEVIVEGENGLLFDAKNSNKLAEKIEQLIKEPEKRKYLAHNAHKAVYPKFDINNVVDKYYKMYTSIVTINAK
ncbi:glycosyltransferase [bacterium]